ncbi:hypothetical protein HN51_043530, partial [Arachis hypogaea]
VLACLRSLIRKCTYQNFASNELVKLFPPDLPLDLQQGLQQCFDHVNFFCCSPITELLWKTILISRLINPVVVSPIIAAVGLSFFRYGFPIVVHERILRTYDDFVWPVDTSFIGCFIIDVEFLDLKICPLNSSVGVKCCLALIYFWYLFRATGDDTRSLSTTVCKWTYLGHAHMQHINDKDSWDMAILFGSFNKSWFVAKEEAAKSKAARGHKSFGCKASYNISKSLKNCYNGKNLLTAEK